MALPSSAVTLDNADSLKLTATSGSVSGTSGSITVVSAAAASLSVSAPSTATAGTGFSIMVAGSDQYGNGYDGNVTLSTSDGQTATPNTVTLVNGTATVNVTLDKADTLTLSATSGSVSGSSGSITVSSAVAASLAVSAPSTATAGAGFSVTVTGTDQYGNGYDGTVTLSASDNQTVSPGTVTLVNGTATVNVTLDTTDTVKLTATSGSISGTSGNITVSSAAAASLSVSAPSTATAGTGFSITVTGSDQYGNGYDGNVTLLATDGQTVTPSTVTLVKGTATVNVTLDKADTLTLSAASRSVSGSSGSITVGSAAAASLGVSAPSTATAGTGFSVTVTGTDQYGNGYDGTISLSASDNQTVSPSTVTLVNGTATITVTLDTADSVKLTATSGSVSGTSGSITVGSATLSSLGVSAPGTATAGTGFSITVTGSDPYGNGYNGSITLSTNDGQAVTPSTVTLVNGTATVGVTLDKADSVKLTATSGAVSGTSSSFTVNPGGLGQLSFSAGPTNATAGTAIAPEVQVELFDPFGNVLTGDSTDTVTLTIANSKGPSTFAGGTRKETATVSGGIATFSNLVVNAAGNYTLGASTTGGLTSALSSSFTISPAALYSFAVSPSTTQPTAGTGFNISIRAKDKYGNTLTTDNGSVTLACSDGQSVYPASVTLNKGAANPLVTLYAPNSSVTLQASAGSIMGKSNSFTVNGANGPSTDPTAQYTFTLYVTAGPGSSPQLLAPSVAPLDNSTFTIIAHSDAQAQLAIANQESLLQQQDDLGAGSTITTVDPSTGIDSVMKAPVGQSNFVPDNLTVTRIVNAATPGPAASFALSFQAINQADSLEQVTVTALDSNGNVASGYTGTVTLSNDDPQFGEPITYTFSPGDQGSDTFAVSLDTAGIRTFTVTDTNSGTLSGQGLVDITAGTAVGLAINTPGTNTVGATDAITVTALDAFGNVAAGYMGTVSFGITKGGAVIAGLPSSYTFTSNDHGGHLFPVVFKTTGSQKITVSDSQNAIQAGPAQVQISAAPAKLVIKSQPPATVAAGTGFGLVVEAVDSHGHVVSNFNGLVTLKLIADPGHGTLVGSTTGNTLSFQAVNGVASFVGVTLNKAGVGYVLRASSGTVPTATTRAFNVSANTASQFVVITQPPSKVIAGGLFGLKVAAEDAFGNVVSSFRGSVTLTLMGGPSGATVDGKLVVTLVRGVATFSGLKITKAGAGNSLTASGSLTAATTNPFTVTPGAATHLAITTQPPASVTAGSTPFGLVVTALDAHDNVATSFAGKVALTLANNPGGSTPSGKFTVQAVAGIITFTDLLLNNPGSGYILKAKSGTLAAQTGTFDVVG